MRKWFICCLAYSNLIGPAASQDLENTFTLENVKVISENNKYLELYVSPEFDKVLFHDISKNFALADIFSIHKSSEGSNVLSAKTLWLDRSKSEPIKGHSPIWSQDNETIYFINYNSNSCKSCYFSMNTGTETPNVPIRVNESRLGAFSVLKPEFINEENSKLIVTSLNKSTSNLEARFLSKPTEIWLVTEKAAKYYNLVPSPDGTKVVCNLGSEMLVFGTSKGDDFQVSLGSGIPTSWDPSGRFILYYLDESDGHEITESNIYIVGLDGTNRSILNSRVRGHIYVNPKWFGENEIIYQEKNRGELVIGRLKSKL